MLHILVQNCNKKPKLNIRFSIATLYFITIKYAPGKRNPGAKNYYLTDLACSTRDLKASESEIAISASIFLFRLIFAFFRPFIKVE